MLDYLGFDLSTLLHDAALCLAAFLLALPLGWERRHGTASVGLRTVPIVAMAACGFAIIIEAEATASAEAQARILQGVITGIGFVGGGAILKSNGSVRGLVTAATIWNSGAIGAAMGFGRPNIAVILSAINIASLVILGRLESDQDYRG